MRPHARVRPRVRFVSVMTAAEIPPEPMQPRTVHQVRACAACCPKKAITPREDRIIGDYDKTACLEMHEELVKERVYPAASARRSAPSGGPRAVQEQGDRRDTARAGDPRGRPRRTEYKGVDPRAQVWDSPQPKEKREEKCNGMDQFETFCGKLGTMLAGEGGISARSKTGGSWSPN